MPLQSTLDEDTSPCNKASSLHHPEQLDDYYAQGPGGQYHSRSAPIGKEKHPSMNSVDYAALGAGSKLSAILLTYPHQVIRARLQQRPGSDGIRKYSDSWHVMNETARYEGVRGFYRGITSNLLKNLPAASLTFVVYENVIKLFRAAKENT